MDMTITLGDAFLLLIGIGAILLVFYAVIFVKNLIPSVKSLANMMADVEVITSIAKDSTEEAQKLVGDVSSSVSTIAGLIKGNQSSVSAATNLVNATAALKNLYNKFKENQK